MTPIDFYVFPRKEVLRIAPISQSFLANWEAARPGVLEDIDIFLPNSRTFKQPVTRYDLFRQVDGARPGVTVVCENWLELLNADGMHHKIADLMSEIRSLYPFSPKVWSWNSDVDQASVPELRDLPDNEFVLCFNSSCPGPQDIVLPFFNVDCRMTWDASAIRPARGGFIGFVGSLKTRKAILQAFHGHEGWELRDTTNGKLPQDEYMRQLLQWDFALCPRGGGLSSYRQWEAIQAGAIPVVFADDYSWPYPDVDWDAIVVRLPEREADSFELIWDLLGSVDVVQRRKRIEAVRERCSLAGVQEAIWRRLDACR